MSAKSPATPKAWVDQDDAPELTDDFFAMATPMIGDKVVTKEEFKKAAARMGRPPSKAPKQSINIRLGADILAAFKATGKGWQTRIDNALRDWLKEHSAA